MYGSIPVGYEVGVVMEQTIGPDDVSSVIVGRMIVVAVLNCGGARITDRETHDFSGRQDSLLLLLAHVKLASARLGGVTPPHPPAIGPSVSTRPYVLSAVFQLIWRIGPRLQLLLLKRLTHSQLPSQRNSTAHSTAF